MNEGVVILILFVASLLIYGGVKRISGRGLGRSWALGLVLLWPIVLVAANGYSTSTKIVSYVLVFPAIYLLARKFRNNRGTP